MVVFGDHPDAISLSQAAEKIFFGPSELEALTFDVQHFGHIAPNQPTDLDFQRLLRGVNPTHDGLLAMRIVLRNPADQGRGGPYQRIAKWDKGDRRVNFEKMKQSSSTDCLLAITVS
jgi:hypothetical protein